jgi:hypothetical protein
MCTARFHVRNVKIRLKGTVSRDGGRDGRMEQ